MPTTASPDRRRATAEHNAGAILDAVERLLNRGEPLTVSDGAVVLPFRPWEIITLTVV